MPRGRLACIDRRSWSVPPIFDLIRKIGRISQPEMDRTYNNGLGMIFIVDKRHANGVVSTLKKIGENCFVIGEIRKGTRKVSFVS
jgi:phosphoribosylformylglycinamidine cyclo-ligase